MAPGDGAGGHAMGSEVIASLFALTTGASFLDDELTDQLAQQMAEGFMAKRLDWDTCHETMTRLFSLAYQEGGPGLTPFGWTVYAAFRLGEERHLGQPEQAGAEYFAEPLLTLALNKHHQMAAWKQ
jgi:hypothetical protein